MRRRIERLLLIILFVVVFFISGGLPRAHARLLCQSDYEVQYRVVATHHGDRVEYWTVLSKVPDMCRPRIAKRLDRVPMLMCRAQVVKYQNKFRRVLACAQPADKPKHNKTKKRNK